MGLKTDWLTIGRSGPTVDGRTIDSQVIQDAAETYQPAVFTALVWPDHNRYENYGKVEALRASKNTEGGLDLQAQISPNFFYLMDNRYGQRLFSSMELTPNFRKSGKAYLTGLGATDNPASAATSEIRFSQEDGEKLHGASCEISLTVDLPKQKSTSLFSRLFGDNPSEEETMDKTIIAAIAEEVKTLSADVKNFTQQPPMHIVAESVTPLVEKPDPYPGLLEKFNAMEGQLGELKAELKAKPVAPVVTVEQFADINKRLEEVTTKLTQALDEADPNQQKSPPHTGDAPNLKNLL
jgi:hypothetical protein